MEKDLRRLILDTTRHLLVSEGYSSLSMRKIASNIGYSATSIYLHFDSKEALFHALIVEGMEMLFRDLQETARSPFSGPVEKLTALCECYLGFGLQNPEYYEIMFMLHAETMGRFPMEKYREARRSLQIIADILEEGVREGLFSATDAYLTANVIWASLHGTVALLLARRLDTRVNREAFATHAIEQVVRGLMTARFRVVPVG